MATVTEQRGVHESVGPERQADYAEAVRAAYDASCAVYPHAGGTALDYGCAPARDGTQLDLTGLNRIVDYTPRDMTIVVEAGVRMADLAATLAAEGQHLPIDVPRAGEATIGGVVATNWNGPRRYGHGTIRDYVIGIHAIDGRGVPFKGGGRVVKNVAGYDLCKLLTGSLGTLGVITQLALKVKPRPESSVAIVAPCSDLTTADAVLARIAELPSQPVAIDLLVGDAWQPPGSPQAEIRNQQFTIVVRVEGTASEVAWLGQAVQEAVRAADGNSARMLDEAEADALWQQQVEFPDRQLDETYVSPLVAKIAVPPSAVINTVASLIEVDADCTIRAQAASGIIIARLKHFRHPDVTSVLVGKLRPAAVRLGGSLVVVSSTLEGLTPHVIWGGRTEAIVLLENVKRQFDPRNILNPGRFVY